MNDSDHIATVQHYEEGGLEHEMSGLVRDCRAWFEQLGLEISKQHCNTC